MQSLVAGLRKVWLSTKNHARRDKDCWSPVQREGPFYVNQKNFRISFMPSVHIWYYRLAKRLRQGFVKDVPDVACHFCLNFPAAITQPGVCILAEPCQIRGIFLTQNPQEPSEDVMCIFQKDVSKDAQGNGGEPRVIALLCCADWSNNIFPSNHYWIIGGWRIPPGEDSSRGKAPWPLSTN